MKNTLSLTGITLALAGLLTSLISMETVHAADPHALLHVQQSNDAGYYSSWSLSVDGSPFYSSSLKTKILNRIPTGTYTLVTVPPTGARTNIKLFKGSVLLQSTAGNSADIVLREGDAIRAVIEYSYVGRIEIRSNPSGVPFELVSGKGEKYSGHTPAVFTNMEPYMYRITYDIQSDCEVQKRQERVLYRYSTLTFFADFNCGARPVTTAGKTTNPLGTGNMPKPKAEPLIHEDRPAIAIVQTASVSETLPGGTVRFTINVRNVTRSTLHNIRVTDTFKAGMLQALLPVGSNGVIARNQEISWDIPTLYAGQVWSTTFEGKVADHLRSGDRVVLTARASNNLIDVLYPEEWSSTVGVGIAFMPQTGKATDALMLIVFALGAALTTTSTIRRKQHVATIS